jgi:hypothetical protein
VQNNTRIFIQTFDWIGVLVAIVLATEPKVRGFKPGRGRWIFKGGKISDTTSFGGEVNPWAPCRKISWHGKGPYEYERDTS